MTIDSPGMSLTNRIRFKSKFSKLSKDLQEKIIIFDIDDSEDLVNYICRQSQILLTHGEFEQAKYALELAEEIASDYRDEFMAAQIGGWIALIESTNSEIINETTQRIKDVIDFTSDYQQFDKES